MAAKMAAFPGKGRRGERLHLNRLNFFKVKYPLSGTVRPIRSLPAIVPINLMYDPTLGD
jgi:hypothetical protein